MEAITDRHFIIYLVVLVTILFLLNIFTNKSNGEFSVGLPKIALPIKAKDQDNKTT